MKVEKHFGGNENGWNWPKKFGLALLYDVIVSLVVICC